MLGEMPLPFSMKGTSLRFICSALSSCRARCSSCFRSFWMIFPRYLYELTCLITCSLQYIFPSQFVIHSVLSIFSSILYLSTRASKVISASYIFCVVVSMIAKSSAKASTPTYSLSIQAPFLYLIISCIIYWMIRLNSIGLVLAPCLTPFQLLVLSLIQPLILYLVSSCSYILSSSWITSLGKLMPYSRLKMS